MACLPILFLMAGGLLIFDSNIVPVGRDQKQHVEVTRDIAIKFIQSLRRNFCRPGTANRAEVAVVPRHGRREDEQSYNNTIEILATKSTSEKK